jgi:uncharacterized membrane protein YhaH (DUF805 family)
MRGASFDASVCMYTSRWHDVSMSDVANAWEEHHLMLVYTVYTSRWHDVSTSGVANAWEEHHLMLACGVCICTSRWHDVSTSGVANTWQEHHLMLVYAYCLHFKVTWRAYVGCWKHMSGLSFDASVCILYTLQGDMTCLRRALKTHERSIRY